MLQKIKDEADRLIAAGSGLDRETAYQRAIASVVMVAAEEQAVTPFEARLLERLDQAVRRGGGRPVSTKLLMVELGVDTWNPWYHLRRLEERGLVHRPQGAEVRVGRGGVRVVLPSLDWAVEWFVLAP